MCKTPMKRIEMYAVIQCERTHGSFVSVIYEQLSDENYDEELTKNIHSTIVEDRKAREKKQEEQKEKLRIEEQREKSRIEEREERLRFEQLRLDEQKRKDEFELEKLRIQTQSKLSADTSKENDTKFLVKEV
ncbi:hypothetical protein TNCV_2153661 [Trichonephila clavipes]|nr:hypothetical protein TNCV_2153661 [Trichonephila clavipes]